MYDKVITRRQTTRRCFNLTWIMKKTSCMLVMLLLLVLSGLSAASTLPQSAKDNLNSIRIPKASKIDTATLFKQTKQDLHQYPFTGFMMPTSSLPGCPLCDSSVYSYCSHKLIHDSCCCDFPGAAIYQKPPQCAYYDCKLLYAKSCYEHSLIENCCCNNPY